MNPPPPAAAVRLASAVVMACLVALAPGCGGSGPQMARVTGTVSHQGKPLSKGNISFVATEPGRPNATATIQSDGSYDLQTTNPSDGAQLGDYRVAVTGTAASEILDYIPKGKAKAAPTSTVPAKYENPESSGLKATVKSGRNSIPFDLE